MEVCKMYWWQHKEKMPAGSSGRIQRGFSVCDVAAPKKFEEYQIDWKLDGCVEPEGYDFV